MRTSNTVTHTTKTRNANTPHSPIIPSISLPIPPTTTPLPHRRRPYRRTPLTLTISPRIPKTIPKIPSLRLNLRFRRSRCRAPLPRIFHKIVEPFRRAFRACLDCLCGLRGCEAGLGCEV